MSLPSPPGEAQLDRQNSLEGDPDVKKPCSLNSFRDFSGETLNDGTEDASSTAKHSATSHKFSLKTFDGAWECEKHPSCVLVLQTAQPFTEELQVLQDKAQNMCLLCLVEQSQAVSLEKATDPIAELDDNKSVVHHDDRPADLLEDKAVVSALEHHDVALPETKEVGVVDNGEDKEPTELKSGSTEELPQQPKPEKADSSHDPFTDNIPDVDADPDHSAKYGTAGVTQGIVDTKEPCQCPTDKTEGVGEPTADPDIEISPTVHREADTGADEVDKPNELPAKENTGHGDTSFASATEDVSPAQPTSEIEVSTSDEAKPTSDAVAASDNNTEFLTAKSGPVPSEVLEEGKHDDEEADTNDSQPSESVQPKEDGLNNNCMNAKDTSSDSVELDDKQAETTSPCKVDRAAEAPENAPLLTDNASSEQPETHQNEASVMHTPFTKDNDSTMNIESSTSYHPAETEPHSIENPLATDVDANAEAEHEDDDKIIQPVGKQDEHDLDEKDVTVSGEATANNLFVPLKDQEEGLDHAYPHLARDSEEGVMEYPDYKAGLDETPEHEQTLEPEELDTPAFQSDKKVMAFVEKQTFEDDTPKISDVEGDSEGPSQVALPESFDKNDLQDGEEVEAASNNAHTEKPGEDALESPSLAISEESDNLANVHAEALEIDKQTGDSHDHQEATQEHGLEDPQTPPSQQPDLDESSLLSPPLSTPELEKLESQINENIATDEQLEDYHDAQEESSADIPVINDDIQDNPAEAIKLPEADTSEIAKDPAEPEDTPMPDADDITPSQDNERAYETPPQEAPPPEETSSHPVKSPTMPGAFPIEEPPQEIELAKDLSSQIVTSIAFTLDNKAGEQSTPETKTQIDEKKDHLDGGKIDLPSTPVKKEKKKKLGSAQRKRLARKATAEAAAKANEEAKNA